MKANELTAGQTVFLRKSEQVWNKPYPMKRSDTYQVRSVILQARVTETKGQEFKALLFGNNGFEKDGQAFVFHENDLLVKQPYADTAALGKWSEPQ